jgi:aspartyl protease family protein
VRPAPPALPPRTAGSQRQVALRADPRGHFEANAVINGRSVPVIVDTGATTVAISSDTARRLGVLPDRSGYRVPISTANGTLRAAAVMLREVTVGSISIRNVEAMVIPGDALGDVGLLGMTFLSRLRKFEISQGQLLLTQ